MSRLLVDLDQLKAVGLDWIAVLGSEAFLGVFFGGNDCGFRRKISSREDHGMMAVDGSVVHTAVVVLFVYQPILELVVGNCSFRLIEHY